MTWYHPAHDFDALAIPVWFVRKNHKAADDIFNRQPGRQGDGKTADTRIGEQRANASSSLLTSSIRNHCQNPLMFPS
jgi:hypothetical protein